MNAVPLDNGGSSPGPQSQPVIHYIDRVPSAIADIDFERQPTSQGSTRPPPPARGTGYAVASPPTSSNVGGAMMRSTGSGRAPPPGGPLGPSSLVGVIHDTMSSLVRSLVLALRAGDI